MDIVQGLRRYERHQIALGRSPHTVKSHHTSIGRLFVPFLQARGHSLQLDDLTLDDVLDWIDDQRERGLSQKTLRTRVVSVRAFTRWLVEEEWLDRDPLRKLKPPKVDDVAKPTLSPAEVERLLAACDRSTLTGCRDLAMLLLLFSTGLRASELVSLAVDDIDWNRALITVRRGKGGKFRVVPMGAKVAKALDRYLNHPKRPAQASAAFLTNVGSPARYKTLQAALQRLEAKTGIHCNPHKFRHSAAITYLRNGGRVETLRAMLGHSTLDMTLHYARIAGVDLTTAHEQADPAKALRTRV